MRGNDFTADWAYVEMFKCHISAELNSIFKNLVLQALGTMWIRFLQKKSKKFLFFCTFKKTSRCVYIEHDLLLLFSTQLRGLLFETFAFVFIIEPPLF